MMSPEDGIDIFSLMMDITTLPGGRQGLMQLFYTHINSLLQTADRETYFTRLSGGNYAIPFLQNRYAFNTQQFSDIPEEWSPDTIFPKSTRAPMFMQPLGPRSFATYLNDTAQRDVYHISNVSINCFRRAMGTCGQNTVDQTLSTTPCSIQCPPLTRRAGDWERKIDDWNLIHLDLEEQAYRCTTDADCPVQLLDNTFPMYQCLYGVCQPTYFTQWAHGEVDTTDLKPFSQFDLNFELSLENCPVSSPYSGINCLEVPHIGGFRSNLSESKLSRPYMYNAADPFMRNKYAPVAGDRIVFQWDTTNLQSKSTNLVSIRVRFVNNFDVSQDIWQIAVVAPITTGYAVGTWPTMPQQLDNSLPAFNIQQTNTVSFSNPEIFLTILGTNSSMILLENDELATGKLYSLAACLDVDETTGNTISKCKNGGVCNTSTGLCQCDPSLFKGELCEVSICHAHVGCDITGTASCDITQNSCSCKTGFVGATCQYNKNCNINPFVSALRCQNYGSIEPKLNEDAELDCDMSTCKCINQWSGRTCQKCELICINGGKPSTSCSACQCPSGFFGNSCQCKAVQASMTLATIPDFMIDFIYTTLNPFYELDQEIDQTTADGLGMANISSLFAGSARVAVTQFLSSLTQSLAYDLSLSPKDSVEITKFSIPRSQLQLMMIGKMLPQQVDTIPLHLDFVVYYGCSASTQGPSVSDMIDRFVNFAEDSPDFFSATRNSYAAEKVIETLNNHDIKDKTIFTDISVPTATQCQMDPKTNLCKISEAPNQYKASEDPVDYPTKPNNSAVDFKSVIPVVVAVATLLVFY